GPAASRPPMALLAKAGGVSCPWVTEPLGTRANKEFAALEKIAPPRIGVILRGRFIQKQHLTVHATAIGPNATQRSRPGTPGRLAVAPIHEGLGIGERRRVGARETDLGIDRVAGHAAFAPNPVAGQGAAGALLPDSPA